MPVIQNFSHRLLAERRKKKRHQDFLLQVINHQKEFHEYHRNNRTKILRSNKALIAYYRSMGLKYIESLGQHFDHLFFRSRYLLKMAIFDHNSKF